MIGPRKVGYCTEVCSNPILFIVMYRAFKEIAFLDTHICLYFIYDLYRNCAPTENPLIEVSHQLTRCSKDPARSRTTNFNRISMRS